jgi:hypothetical protein
VTFDVAHGTARAGYDAPREARTPNVGEGVSPFHGVADRAPILGTCVSAARGMAPADTGLSSLMCERVVGGGRKRCSPPSSPSVLTDDKGDGLDFDLPETRAAVRSATVQSGEAQTRLVCASATAAAGGLGCQPRSRARDSDGYRRTIWFVPIRVKLWASRSFAALACAASSSTIFCAATTRPRRSQSISGWSARRRRPSKTFFSQVASEAMQPALRHREDAARAGRARQTGMADRAERQRLVAPEPHPTDAGRTVVGVVQETRPDLPAARVRDVTTLEGNRPIR